MWQVILFTVLLGPAWSEVWKKPVYRPDENHLPWNEIQKEEERKERHEKKEKKHTKTIRRRETPKDPSQN
jgi:hypothetical protein